MENYYWINEKLLETNGVYNIEFEWFSNYFQSFFSESNSIFP